MSSDSDSDDGVRITIFPKSLRYEKQYSRSVLRSFQENARPSPNLPSPLADNCFDRKKQSSSRCLAKDELRKLEEEGERAADDLLKNILNPTCQPVVFDLEKTLLTTSRQYSPNQEFFGHNATGTQFEDFKEFKARLTVGSKSARVSSPFDQSINSSKSISPNLRTERIEERKSDDGLDLSGGSPRVPSCEMVDSPSTTCSPPAKGMTEFQKLKSSEKLSYENIVVHLDDHYGESRRIERCKSITELTEERVSDVDEARRVIVVHDAEYKYESPLAVPSRDRDLRETATQSPAKESDSDQEQEVDGEKKRRKDKKSKKKKSKKKKKKHEKEKKKKKHKSPTECHSKRSERSETEHAALFCDAKLNSADHNGQSVSKSSHHSAPKAEKHSSSPSRKRKSPGPTSSGAKWSKTISNNSYNHHHSSATHSSNPSRSSRPRRWSHSKSDAQLGTRSRSRSRSRVGRERDVRRPSESRGHRKGSKSKSRSPNKSRSKSRSRSREDGHRHQVAKTRREGYYTSFRPRSRSRSRSRSRGRLKIDKNKLLEIARANVLAAVHKGEIIPGVQLDEMAVLKSGGKSVDELVEYCRRIAEDRADRSSTNDDSQPVTDEDDELAQCKLRERPDAIIMNIRNAIAREPRTSVELRKEQVSQLRQQFPVSSGAEHRIIADVTLVPQPPSQVAPVVSVPQLPPTPIIPEPVVIEEKPDISTLVTERARLMRALNENPSNPTAIHNLAQIDQQMQQWAQAQVQPGQFLGSTGIRILTPQQLGSHSGPSLRRDYLTSTQRISGGVGKKLLEKMGWREGRGLGKNEEGSVEPLLLDVKHDRRGLTSQVDSTHVNLSESHFVPKGHRMESIDKHPVSALLEFCKRRMWLPPHFELIREEGPPHCRTFLMKVTVNGVDYQPTICSGNKKTAKAHAAKICLQTFGLISADS